MIDLRPHQQAAYDAAIATDRGIIKMFCGTGKTRVILRLTLDGAEPLTLIVFPRIALVAQFKRDYLENAEWAAAIADFSCIYICSEDEKDGDFTTDRDTIEDYLLSDADKKIVCITYQSLPILAELLEDLEMTVDLAIFDEAHHCEAEQTYDLLTSGLTMDRSYFFTATPTDVMEADEDEVFGDVLFSYTHRDAVEADICNEFEIVCRFALPGECNIYEHMAAAYARSPNGRILAFHSFAEAEVEGRTSVAQYSGTKALRECTAAFKPAKPTLQAVIAKTKGKQAIIDAFEATADDQISILHNCSILGEGIDTKAANAIVFADPKSSTTQIIQNIGRATRRPAGVQRPASIIIPVVVDIGKFQGLTTAEERHKVLCDEFTKGGFQAIQNVLAALRQEDEELMDTILRSPTCYTKAEVERTFMRAGYVPTATAATVGELCGIGPEATEEEAAAAIGRPLEIHGQSMEAPVRTIGSGDTSLKVMHADDTWAKMEGEGVVKPPRRPVKVRYDVCDKLGIQWSAIGPVEIGAATIDCTLGVDNWEERRQEWIAMYEKLGKISSGKSKDKDEKRMGQWQCDQRKYYKKQRMPQERISILNQTPNWKWEEDDTWEPNRQHWIIIYEKLGKCPSEKSKDSEEKKAGQWQSRQRKNYKDNKSWMTKERIIILNNTPGWKWEKEDTWEPNRQNWIKVFKQHNRCPRKESKDADEKRAGLWQCNMRKGYKDNKPWMTNERIDILNNTTGWSWGMTDTRIKTSWTEQLDHWKLVFKETNRTPSQTSQDENEKRAGQWQSDQRKAYSSNSLKKERIEILNSTDGWKWTNEDTWEPSRQNWIYVYNLLGKCPTEPRNKPTLSSEEILIKRAAQWQSQQRKYYKQKNSALTDERISILNITPGWIWEVEGSWEPQRQHWIHIHHILGRAPYQSSKDPEEKRAGLWQQNQRQRYKKGKMCEVWINILNATPGWKWVERGLDTASTTSEESAQPAISIGSQPTAQPLTIRRYSPPATEQEKPITIRRQPREISEIGKYHQRFHNLNSATYASEITPAEFAAYHAIADTLDARDAPERQVMSRLSTLCRTYILPKCQAIDLGCGKNRLRTLVPHATWTSVDAVAADPSVQVADLGALPFTDFQFHAAILSRALWGRDQEKQLAEAYRILSPGAPLIVCESRRRWLGDDGTNQLLEHLKSAGFHIKVEPDAASDEPFQYIVAQKPALL